MMKFILLLPLVFIAACIHGDASMPQISKVRLPDSPFSVYLHGPSQKREYVYSLETSRGSYNTRSLGFIDIDPSVTTRVTKERDGVYRVQWGNAAAAPYALIDLKNRLIVEDSNPNNAQKEPIKPRVFE